MPRVPEIESLVKLCVYRINKAVRSSKLATCPLARIYWDENAITSIHQLPVNLSEEIIQSFIGSRKEFTAPRIINNLITSQIHHLSLAHYDCFLSLFPKFGNLLVLDLDNGGVGDSVLKSIGIYCSQLRSLNLRRCLLVTDIGIQWLCGVDDSGENGKSGLCKTIQKLNILYTRVTQQGIQVALKNLPSLNILENFNTVEALAQMAKSTIDSKRPGVYNNMFSVSTLYTSFDKPYRSNSLYLALSLCYSVNQVSIHVTKELKDSDLSCLISLKILRKFEILLADLWTRPKVTKITFDGGVAPLLKVFGKSLETLSLEGLNFFRILTIIEFCPNLNALCFRDTWGFLENERNLFHFETKPPVFKELKFLYCTHKVPDDILLFLLSSPSLEHIRFFNCNALSDAVLIETVKRRQLKNLRKLKLLHCHSITKRGIVAFLLNGCNPLETLDFDCCKNIRLNHYEDLLALIAYKKWNLNISRH